MLRRLVPVALALALTAAALGCGGDTTSTPIRYNASVDFMGMAPHLGQMLELRVVHAATGVEVAYWKVPQIVSPNFTVTASDCLVVGETYYVDFYADLNGDGSYDAPPTDHAWRRWINPASGPMVVSFTHDIIWTDIDFPPHG